VKEKNTKYDRGTGALYFAGEKFTPSFELIGKFFEGLVKA